MLTVPVLEVARPRSSQPSCRMLELGKVITMAASMLLQLLMQCECLPSILFAPHFMAIDI